MGLENRGQATQWGACVAVVWNRGRDGAPAKRKKLFALTKEVRQEQQAMATAEAQLGAGKLTEIGSIALPLGFTLVAGVLREVSAQRAGHNLPQRC